MQIAAFEAANQTHLGIVVPGGMIDISKHTDIRSASLVEIIEDWDRYSPVLAKLAEMTPDFDLDAVRLLPPIARPGKIFALGMNYKDHCAEVNAPVPEYQSWFVKAATAVNGPRDPLELPAASDQLDYEAELVVVIGKRAKNVSEDDAADVIFGYCVGNDVSVRDWQLRTQQHSLGKSFDTAAPFGPWITTADSVDVADLRVRSFVNDELRQDSRTSQFVFSVHQMVSYLSQAMTLEPGDILYTGTPSGVGIAQPGGPKFLRAGDIVRVEIEGLGEIENPVVEGSGRSSISGK